MPVIRFHCEATAARPAKHFFEEILRVEAWTSFKGYGPIPAIRSAAFVHRTESITGAIIRVENSDGSSHTETIIEWSPPDRLVMELAGFSPPLSRLASRFIEAWTFTPTPTGTHIRRDFTIEPRNALATPPLWIIARFLKRAVRRNLQALINKR